jgi:sulfur carrier protein
MGCQPTEDIVEIALNGERRRTAAGQTVSGLLRELQLDPARVAVEVDKRIVKRDRWDTLELPAGASVEVVQFVGGG